VNCIDFRYCTDVLTKLEAIELLKQNQHGKSARLDNLLKKGYLAYTTAPGWLGYSDEKMISLCDKYKKKGFTAFKIKIGVDLNRDIERCRLMRDQIGFESTFMLDSNQIFDVDQAIEWVKQLKNFKVRVSFANCKDSFEIQAKKDSSREGSFETSSEFPEQITN
jgi:L-fuconate dehydratase